MRADAQRNRELILAAARETFAEQGVDGSLEEVARRAGVGVGTLYRRFPNRDALIEALLHERFERLDALAVELLGADDPLGALRTWLEASLSDVGTFKGVAASLKPVMHDPDTALGGACQGAHEGWRRLVVRAQRAGFARPDADAMDVLRLAHGIAWSAEGAEPDPGRTGRMLDLVLGGLRAQPGDRPATDASQDGVGSVPPMGEPVRAT